MTFSVAIRRVLFVTMTNDIGSERIVSDIGRLDVRCAVLGQAGSYAGLCRRVERQFVLPTGLGRIGSIFAVRGALENAFLRWSPDAIVPLDELAAGSLRAIVWHRRVSGPLRDILIRSLGDPTTYTAARHRVALMQVAADEGVAVPAFAGVDSVRDVAAAVDTVGYPLFVKRDQTSGAAGVVLVENRADLLSGLRRAALKSALKRGIAHLAGMTAGSRAILFQAHTAGRLAFHTAVCRAGRYIDGASFEALRSNPQNRASTVLSLLRHEGMEVAARRMIAALRCSGFVSFDFIVTADGRALMIEMNARPIGSTHLGRWAGHDLSHAFVFGRARDGETEPKAPRSIALFPKEFERDPGGLDLELPGVLHDVPVSEPAVVGAYLRRLAQAHPECLAQYEALCSRTLDPADAAEPAWPSRRSKAFPADAEQPSLETRDRAHPLLDEAA